jgi:hypothetical protein
MQRNDDDNSIRWWEEPDQEEAAESHEAQTRPANHPDGFSFLMPHPDAFWQTWLAFSPQEIQRLRFLRWRYQHGHLTEWPAEEKVAA